jgi:hypothetical protein
MNRAQKIAWLMVITTIVAFFISCVMVAILAAKSGFPKALEGFFLVGLAGIGGLGHLIFKKDEGQVKFDERDLMIQRKATLRAYSIFWFLFVLAATIPFFVLGPKGTVSVRVLPAMVIIGMVVVMLVQSIVTLEEYGCNSKGEKS